MSSKYKICITRDDDHPVHLIPGGKGERDLVAAIVDTTLAKGVAYKSAEHIKKDLTDAIDEVLLEIKSEVRPA